MANVLLTETCIRSCPYCFAKQYMSDADVNDALTWDNLIYIADFLQSSGENHISLLGGEPLIHKDIAEFIQYLSSRGFFVTIFTSGIMQEDRFEDFANKINTTPNINVGFVVNVNEPRLSPKSEGEKLRRFFTAFGSRSSLSFNIYRTDFQMDFLITYILKYGLNRHIRLGLAHPIPGVKNKYITPDHFSDIKDALLSYFEKFAKDNIEPGFDCGFPMCMFNDEELGKVFKYTGGTCSFQCGPAIDIGTDLSVWSCFPLSSYNRKSLFDFSNFQELNEFYAMKMGEVRKEVRGLYTKCDICKNFERRLCSGGCLAHVINHFIKEGKIREDIYD